MHTGMLWFNNDPKKTLQVKVQEALDYYIKKYGRTPDLCLLHPDSMKDQVVDIKNLTVRPYRPVLPGHIWIGIEDKS